MKILKILLAIIVFGIFYLVLVWHGLIMGFLVSEFLCPYLGSWAGCELNQAGDIKGDLYFIITSILFFWFYAGFVIHWNYKPVSMTAVQRMFSMIFFALVSYPFLYGIGNGLYSKYFIEPTTFIYTFLVGTFFSIIVWIFLALIYFFIQSNEKIKQDFEKNNIKK